MITLTIGDKIHIGPDALVFVGRRGRGGHKRYEFIRPARPHIIVALTWRELRALCGCGGNKRRERA